MKPLWVHNRKYIGSKQNLLPFIEQVVTERAPDARPLADPFTGSAAVAYHFAARGLAVTAADNLYHNYIAARCFLGGRPGDVRWDRVAELLARLNDLPPEQGYCGREFGGTYFTEENAGRIDAHRESIARWREEGVIGEQEEAVLLTSLIYAADKVADTCGQYDAFLKHLGASPTPRTGRTWWTRWSTSRWNWACRRWWSRRPTGSSADADELIDHMEADVLYLDPPYNGRQYIDNYHVLENIRPVGEAPPLRQDPQVCPRRAEVRLFPAGAAGQHLTRLIRRASAAPHPALL